MNKSISIAIIVGIALVGLGFVLAGDKTGRSGDEASLTSVDGEKVVIGANLNDKNFDVAVGLALHEGSHSKSSDFNI